MFIDFVLRQTNVKTVAYILLLAIVLCVFNQFILIGIVTILCIALLQLKIFRSDFYSKVIGLIIVGFLTVTSDIGDIVRLGFNVVSIITLFYFFLKHYVFFKQKSAY